MEFMFIRTTEHDTTTPAPVGWPIAGALATFRAEGLPGSGPVPVTGSHLPIRRFAAA